MRKTSDSNAVAAGAAQILASAKGGTGPQAVPVVQADALFVGEGGLLAGNLFADNGNGADTDPDAPLQVSAVNSLAAMVGTQITLASGALLTVNANGSASYNPNGAFNYLPGPLSGATNQTATDSFTYTLAGGGTATVTITIVGVSSASGDILRGGAGVNNLVGGAGNDTVSYIAAAAGVFVGLNNNAASNDGDGSSDTFSGVENVTGSNFDDTIIGADNVNVLQGGAGRDYLIGLGGSDILYGGFGVANQLQGGFGDDDYYVDAFDTITEFNNQGYDQVYTSRDRYNLAANLEELIFTGTSAFVGGGNNLDNLIQGGSGNDYLNGRGGADVLRGGDGIDVGDYLFAIDDVIASLADGMTTNDGDDSVDVLESIEGLRGSNHDDQLTGNALANLLDGAGGDDTLNGGDGADTLRGAAGEDVLVGGGGSDMIVGGADDDFLSGGEGAANHLQGGTGNDTYILGANDTLVEFAGEGFDRVETARNFYVLRANFESLEYTGTGTFAGGGNDGNNTLIGGAGSDTLTGGRGNDTLNGRDGFDTVVLAGVRSDYSIVELASGSFRITDGVAGRDGIDTLTGVEQVRFLNGELFALEPALAPVVSAKDAGRAEVMPGLSDDDFVLSGDGGGLLTLPVDPGARLDRMMDAGAMSDPFMLTMREHDMPMLHPSDFGGAFGADDWFL